MCLKGENMNEQNRGGASSSRRKIVLCCIIGLIVLCALAAGAFAIYVSDYYHAADVEYAKENGVEKNVYQDHVTYGDADSTRGFIFYPGGKVEAEAYEPLLCSISEAGYFCILVKMPFNLAVLDMDAAQDIRQKYDNVAEWYIGGHSLGGAMAASYVAGNAEQYEGLVLMAAYPTNALPEGFPVLSIYGSEDGVLNMEKYQKGKQLAPTLTEIVINGGNHSQFGNYGIQKKDGSASISNVSQWQQVAEAMSSIGQKE